jgi:putative transposase
MAISTDDLDVFLAQKRDGREVKRAIAVKMALKGYLYSTICDILNVTPSFVSDWKQAYLATGTDGLLLQYQGSKGLLTSEQRQAVLDWLQMQQSWSVEQLQTYIETNYRVVFQSRQSYYDLLAQAKITHKKAQRTNPKRDDTAVAAKKKR